jgi:hypothetical protein
MIDPSSLDVHHCSIADEAVYNAIMKYEIEML